MTTYLRPLGFLYGPDARRALASGDAGALGGSVSIAFSQVEIVTRQAGRIDRRVAAYAQSAKDCTVITRSRPPLAGLDLSAPRIMGIVNVTPDSFSDGGLNEEAATAIANGNLLAEEGADILDIGGESTRPGSDPVPEDEECRRILPVITALAASGHRVSVDTRKAAVMAKAASAGARIINDVSALGHDPQSLATAARLGLPVILMHAKGDPKTMQVRPEYDDVALDVFDALKARIDACIAAGIEASRIAVDPGIGFGKTFRHNLDLLHQLALFHGLGVPLMIGLSRKAFIGSLTMERNAGRRVHGSTGGAVQAALSGAQILRVHDVAATRQALAVALAAADPERAPV
jgi:dihydropteroate synthase